MSYASPPSLVWAPITCAEVSDRGLCSWSSVQTRVNAAVLRSLLNRGKFACTESDVPTRVLSFSLRFFARGPTRPVSLGREAIAGHSAGLLAHCGHGEI